MKNATKLFSIFILVLFLGSMFIFAISFKEPEDPYLDTDQNDQFPEEDFTVGDIPFYISPEGNYRTLLTTSDGRYVYMDFHLDPRNAGNISLDNNTIPMILGASKVYLTYNPNQDNFTQMGGFFNQAMSTTSVGISLARPDLVTPTTVYIIGAQTEDIVETDSDDTVPIKTCADSTEQEPVLYFKIADTNRIYIQDECIIVEGPAEDLVYSADKLAMWLIKLEI